MSGADKWRASNNAYNSNKNANTSRANEQFGRDLTNEIDSWYKSKNPVSKYYFRTDDRNKEYDNFINYQTEKEKNDLTNSLNKNFAGFNGSNSWVDNYWNLNSNPTQQMGADYLQTKYDDAYGQLEAAYKRGALNQKGFNKAISDLDFQKSGATSYLNGISNNLMDTYRGDLTNKLTNLASDIDNYTLGQHDSINSDSFKNAIDSMYNTQQNNLQNDFNSAVSGYTPFDFGGLLGTAQSYQGIDNTVTDEQQDAFNEEASKKNKKIGLGNSGLF